ncbi:hypothetical protein, partial [Pseudomonas aeruginosa]
RDIAIRLGHVLHGSSVDPCVHVDNEQRTNCEVHQKLFRDESMLDHGARALLGDFRDYAMP